MLGLRSSLRLAQSLLYLGFAVGVAGGCLLEIDRRISCGDGFIDEVAGEECDPETAFDRDACRELGLGNGDAKCHPETCELMLTELDCSVCGDGVATGDEQCDGFDFKPGVRCASGKGEIRCTQECTPDYLLCDPCGNGVTDPGEECDPNRSCDEDIDCPVGLSCDLDNRHCVAQGGVLPVVFCAAPEIEVTATIVKDSYTSGAVTQEDCLAECKFDRTHCGFCGDGVWDDSYQDIGPQGPVTLGEECDGEEADLAAKSQFCKVSCFEDPDIVACRSAA